MKIGRTALTVLLSGCALSASAMADQPAVMKKVVTASPAGTVARVVPTFQILPSGERIPVTTSGRPMPRGAVVPFNNQDCPDCSTGLNVAYVNPGSYDGSNPSGQASIFGLGEGPAATDQLTAPSAPGATPPIPLPTDIVWNDYLGDETIWPGGATAEAALVEYSFVTARLNTLPGAVDRTDAYRILFFTADGAEFKGGFEFTIPTLAGQGFYQQVTIDLVDLDPPLFIPIEGLQMVDCPRVAENQPAVGVGLAFAGGDLANPNFPLPEDLVEAGFILSLDWLFADGETGLDGPPSQVDPLFDLEEGVSYLDILNTGFLVDWQFTSALPGGKIGTRTMTHDFPSRFTMTDGTTTIGACAVLAGNFCFETTEADCLAQGGIYNGDGTVCGVDFGACCVEGECSEVIPGICAALGGEFEGDFTSCSSTKCTTTPECACDFNGSGTLNSQDFFDFLSAFFGNNETADFNEDGQINSQDFFDFLSCFFQPPAGC